MSALCSLVAMLFFAAVSGCAGVRIDVARPTSQALEYPSQTTLGRSFAPQAEAHPAMSGFNVIDAGPAAFQSRAALADAAERTLDLQYYIVGDDRSTDLLLQRIAAAGLRGVRVRVLLDDVHSPNRDFARRALALGANTEVRLFNPFLTGGVSAIGRLLEFVGDSERLNRRMHNKLWVADNAVAVVGGRNLGDEYFDTVVRANFSDLDLLVVGPVVDSLSRCFDQYWNSPAAVPFAAFLDAQPGLRETQRAQSELLERLSQAAAARYQQWLHDSEMAPSLKAASLPLDWGRAQASCDRPDKPLEEISDDIRHNWLDGSGTRLTVRTELIVVSPYFIPSEPARQHLGDMHRRGVRVAVLTNSLASTDALAAHAGYARYRAELLRRGVELFEFRAEPGAPHPISHRWRRMSPSSLHAKFIIVDRERAIIGSNNQDPRSRRYNTESWIAVESPALVARLLALFDESTLPDHSYRVVLRDSEGPGDALRWITEDKGQAVHHGTEPAAGWWLHFWSGVLAVLVPEDLL